MDNAQVNSLTPTATNSLASEANLVKRLNRPIAGFTLLAFISIALPIPALAQAPVAQNVQSATGAPVETAYTLGGGDRVRIDVFNIPEYSGEFLVLIDGTVNLPIIGGVPVQGLTLREASDLISARYAPFIRRPIVTLSLLAPRPLNIVVAGEVYRPGSYNIPLVVGTPFPTITQAIQLAGGVTQAAEARQVLLRRQSLGREQIFNINLLDLFQRGDSRQNVNLRDGDTIFIPTATNVSLNAASQIAASNLTAQTVQPVRIAIVGEVYRPGPYTVAPDTSTNAANTNATNPNTTPSSNLPRVTRAIQVAGGITPLADIRQIQVRRPTRTGTNQLININLWQLLQAGDTGQDLILQDGDTILIPTATNLTPTEATQLSSASFAPNAIRVYVVGEVNKTQTSNPFVEVPPNTPLNQVLLAAGSFNTRARQSRVDLIRLNPNGTVSRRTVPVDFNQGINEKTNPIMRNNDVIVVGRSTLASISDTLGSVLSPIGGFFSLFNFFRIFQ